MEKVRPKPRSPLTLLFGAQGAPATEVSVAGAVAGSTLIVPRRPSGLSDAASPGADVTVLFTREGRLYRWPMRVEEVLPSSYYLVAVREPGEGDRREFVRAEVPLQLRVRVLSAGEAPWRVVSARVDVSASGFRLEGLDEQAAGTRLRVEIRSLEGGPPVIAVAEVVRSITDGDRCLVACHFVSMDSADESRLVDIVFAVREAALRARLGL